MCGRFETKKIEKSIIDQFRSLQLPLSIDEEIDIRPTIDIRPADDI